MCESYSALGLMWHDDLGYWRWDWMMGTEDFHGSMEVNVCGATHMQCTVTFTEEIEALREAVADRDAAEIVAVLSRSSEGLRLDDGDGLIEIYGCGPHRPVVGVVPLKYDILRRIRDGLRRRQWVGTRVAGTWFNDVRVSAVSDPASDQGWER